MIWQKLVRVNKEFKSIRDIRTALHIPFISGNGIYQACVNVVINALSLNFEYPKTPEIFRGDYYYSGGTVKTKLDDLKCEVDQAKELGFNIYKLRLILETTATAAKINFLNKQALQYSVDFIVNTNYQIDYKPKILKLTKQMDAEKVSWIEEPVVPMCLLEESSYLQQLKDMKFKVAIGESFNSILNFQVLCHLVWLI